MLAYRSPRGQGSEKEEQKGVWPRQHSADVATETEKKEATGCSLDRRSAERHSTRTGAETRQDGGGTLRLAGARLEGHNEDVMCPRMLVAGTFWERMLVGATGCVVCRVRESPFLGCGSYRSSSVRRFSTLSRPPARRHEGQPKTRRRWEFSEVDRSEATRTRAEDTGKRRQTPQEARSGLPSTRSSPEGEISILADPGHNAW